MNQQQKIPEGWKEQKLGEVLLKIEGGGTPSKINQEYWNGSLPWASVKDVVTHNPNDTQDHISELGLKNSSSRLVPKGVLVIPTRMALGHVVRFNVDVAINQDLKAIYPKEILLNDYLFYWFKSKKKYIEKLGSGSTVSGIQLGDLKKIDFRLPRLKEQQCIVQILETWNKYLEKLNQKIKIKKNIKKGLMQNLLTEKIRLNSFNKEWEKTTVKNIFEIKKGTGLSKEKLIENGQNECILYGELYTRYNEIIKKVISKTNSFEGLKSKKGDILIPGSTTTNAYDLAIASVVLKDTIFLGGDINVLRPKNLNISSEFYGYYLTHAQKKNLTRIGQGITIVHLYGKDIGKIIIDLPEVEEQNAIANILMTADKEIETLEKQKEIIKNQKKYLLNNLITGQIRLPEFA